MGRRSGRDGLTCVGFPVESRTATAAGCIARARSWRSSLRGRTWSTSRVIRETVRGARPVIANGGFQDHRRAPGGWSDFLRYAPVVMSDQLRVLVEPQARGLHFPPGGELV